MAVSGCNPKIVLGANCWTSYVLPRFMVGGLPSPLLWIACNRLYHQLVPSTLTISVLLPAGLCTSWFFHSDRSKVRLSLAEPVAVRAGAWQHVAMRLCKSRLPQCAQFL